LLASSDIMDKNRNSLACLRNAGSYSAVTYCTVEATEKRKTTPNMIKHPGTGEPS
jgi:hypothetical protein